MGEPGAFHQFVAVLHNLPPMVRLAVSPVLSESLTWVNLFCHIYQAMFRKIASLKASRSTLL